MFRLYFCNNIFLKFANYRQDKTNIMASQFGASIRTLRGKHNLFQRQVVSLLEMDTGQLSKIEKGSRQLKWEQIHVIAKT